MNLLQENLMIKVRVQLDGDQFGYVTYTCKETFEEYQAILFQDGGCPSLIALTEIDSEAIITIPIKRYVVEVWPITNE